MYGYLILRRLAAQVARGAGRNQSHGAFVVTFPQGGGKTIDSGNGQF